MVTYALMAITTAVSLAALIWPPLAAVVVAWEKGNIRGSHGRPFSSTAGRGCPSCYTWLAT